MSKNTYWKCKNCKSTVSYVVNGKGLSNPNLVNFVNNDGESIGCANCGSLAGYKLVVKQLPPEDKND